MFASKSSVFSVALADLATQLQSSFSAFSIFQPINCTQKLGNLGGNLQYPILRQGGGSDDPGALCSDGVIEADPLLGPLQNNGGPTLTMAPASNSPATAKGNNNCPAADERGQTRQIPCTLGASEPLNSSGNQNTPLNRSGWKITASSNAGSGQTPDKAVDGDANTRWSTGKSQTNGQYFQVDMGTTQTFSKLVLDAGNSSNDYPRGYAVYVSNDDKIGAVLLQTVPGVARSLRLPSQLNRLVTSKLSKQVVLVGGGRLLSSTFINLKEKGREQH